MKHYGNEICIISGSTFTKGNIVFSASLSVDEAVKKLDIKGNDIKAKISDVALILRERVNKTEKRQLPHNLKSRYTKISRTIFSGLIVRLDKRRWAGNLKQVKTKSTSEMLRLLQQVGCRNHTII